MQGAPLLQVELWGPGCPPGLPKNSGSPWAEEGLCELCWWLACSPTADPEGLGMYVGLGSAGPPRPQEGLCAVIRVQS